jgi:c(7)-type cytochrome triheme protein
MRFVHVGTFALVLGIGLAFPALDPVAAQQVKIPPDFAYEKGKESPGVVTFSHEKHKTNVEKCTACHVKVFKMKKGTTGAPTMEQMKAGQQCGACHNGKTEMGGKVVFSIETKEKCESCHKKQ